MKKLTLVLLLVGLMLASAYAAVVQDIDSPTARKMLKENLDIYLLDVRTPQEYFQVRLAGSHLIPIDKLIARIAEVPTDRPLVVYCAVGSRSAQVAEYLARKGYPEVYDLRGGIEAWSKLYRFPVLSGAP